MRFDIKYAYFAFVERLLQVDNYEEEEAEDAEWSEERWTVQCFGFLWILKVVSKMISGSKDMFFVGSRFGHVESACESRVCYAITKEIQSRPLAIFYFFSRSYFFVIII